MQLTTHFSLSEFIRSDKAGELGNLNMPDNDAEMANIRAMAETMEQVRALFGCPIPISSGYRNRIVNAAVGGVPNSDHALGLACDFLPAGYSVAAAVKRIRNSSIKFDQLIDEPTWVHLGIGHRMRREVLRARRNAAGKMIYTKI